MRAAVITGFVLMCLSLPIIAEERSQQRSLDTLLNDIQAKQRTQAIEEHRSSPEDLVRRLKNQLIDIRVERDQLEEHNAYLRRQIENLRNERNSSRECLPDECIPLVEVEQKQLVRHTVHSLSLYRLAEFMDSVIPEEDVEAHRRAQKIMEGAKADLELLGFDTSNPDDFPTLEELLEHFEILHEANGRPSLRAN